MPDPASDVARLIRACGIALFLAGLLAAGANAILTPRLPVANGSVAVVTSTAFGMRMPVAAVSVALATAGCLGLYLAQADRLRWGRVAFLLAAIGGLMAFYVESVQFTLVRDLAFEVPEVYEQLDDGGRLRRWDLGFAIGAGTFAIGWLAVAIVTLRLGVLRRRGPLTLIAGMLLVPVLGAVGGIWGAVVGNVVLGAGWAVLGLDLRRAA